VLLSKRVNMADKLQPGKKYSCPCCRFRTLDARGDFHICPVCFWEDDGQDDQNADVVHGGANRGLSLTQARQNYLTFGAADHKDLPHVRPPTAEEKEDVGHDRL
jgi:hypothetical protein